MKNLFPILLTLAIIYFLITPTSTNQNKPLPSPPNKTIIDQPVLDDHTTVEKPETFNESDVVFGGYPKPKAYPNEITVLNRGAFVIGYDEIRKCPVWVAYKVTPDDDYISPKRPSHFEVDFETKSKSDLTIILEADLTVGIWHRIMPLVHAMAGMLNWKPLR